MVGRYLLGSDAIKNSPAKRELMCGINLPDIGSNLVLLML